MTDDITGGLDLLGDWLDAKGYAEEAGLCTKAMDLIHKQDARIAELEAALKPFAEKADDVLKNLHGGHVNYIPELISVTLGDLRAARAALGEKE